MMINKWACKLACVLWLALVIRKTDAVRCQTKDGLTLFEVLERTPNVTVFTSLIRQGGLIPVFNNKRSQMTLFVPLDYAFGNILPLGKGYFDIFPGEEIPKVIVNYHAAVPATPPRKLKEDLELTAGLQDPEGEAMTLTITENELDPLKPYVVEGATNMANITRTAGKPPGFFACNSVVYLVDTVLLPSKKIIASNRPRVSVRAAELEALSFEPLVTPRPGPKKPRVVVEEDEEEEEDDVVVPPTGPATPDLVPPPEAGTGK